MTIDTDFWQTLCRSMKGRDVRERGKSKQVLSASSAVLAAAVLLASGAGGVGARPTVQSLQVDESEIVDASSATIASDSFAVGDVAGANPTVSGDGRYVVFQGSPRLELDADGTIVTEADGRLSTVYLTDRESGETTEISTVPDGLRPGNSVYPVISGDGCVAAIVTEIQLDVFRDDDTGSRWDVYRSALPHCGGALGDWELISTRADSGGLARDDVVVAPVSINRSATLIAYAHPADHLYEADGVNTVSLVDLAVPVTDVGRSRHVAGTPSDTPDTVFTHNGIDQPVLSDDGTHLAYRSDASSADAVPGWGTGLVEGGPATPQVFVWDIGEPDPFLAVQLVSSIADGAPTLAGAGSPDISRDGTSVVFTSSDTELVTAQYPVCTEGCPSQVFLLDRDSNNDGLVDVDGVPAIRLISSITGSNPLVAGTAPSSQPSISADGQLVAFVSKATNLQLIQSPGIGGGDDGEILVAELDRRALTRITTDVDGVVPTAGVHAHPDLSDTGRTAVYDSSAATDLLGDAGVGGRQIIAKSSPPALSLADANLGTTIVGLASDEWYVSVVNDGPATFQPAEVSIDNPQFVINDESQYNTCFLGAAVPAGGNCTVALKFTPGAAGLATATLRVAEVGFDAVETSATISGSGGEPALRIEPGGIDFPPVTVGEAGIELQVDVSNISVIPTEVVSFDLSGEHASDFVVYSNNCIDRPLNPRAACSVGVVFIPTDAGRRTALLELETTSGQVTTAIIGGDGEFAPVVELDVSEIQVGREFIATGSQYPANTEVTVVFGDGPNSSVTAVTDDGGNFSIPVPVATTERGGSRTIVVQTTTGAAASAPVEVIEAGQQWIGMPGFGLG